MLSRCITLTFQCGQIFQINCVYATAKTVIGINTKIIRTDLEYPLTFIIAERAANVQKSRETLLCILLFVFL